MKGLLALNPTAVHPVVRAIVQAGAGLSAVEAYEGQYALAACARAAEAVWNAADVLVLPTTGTIYRIAEVLAEPFALNANLGLYTNFVNLLDLAAVAVPAGFRSHGAGFGVSLIAPAWTDAALLGLAAMPQAGWAKPGDLSVEGELSYGLDVVPPDVVDNSPDQDRIKSLFTGEVGLAYDAGPAILRASAGAHIYPSEADYNRYPLTVGAQIDWGLAFGTIPSRPAFEAYAARLRERPAYKRQKEIDNALIAEMQKQG
jgi:hypothetical protein